MNSTERVREYTKGGRFRTVIGICLCFSVLGFLAGFALDAKYRPNRILLYINADGKVSLSPEPGDIISFAAFDDETGASVAVNHTAGFIPCDPNSKFPPPTCVYAPFTDGPNLYLFGCTSAGGISCFDPQYGPKCPKCPGGQTHVGYSSQVLYFAEVFSVDVKRLLFSPVKRMLPIQVVTIAPSPPPPTPSNVNEVAAKCNGNAPAVYLTGSSTPTTSIPARPLDTITWNNYDRDYVITNLNICTQPALPSSGGTNQSCTIKGGSAGNVTYTLTMTCNNVKSDMAETISLP